MRTAEELVARDEYLFPYLWAQRQYRRDRYQMASAAELEDLFFDTVGAFLRQHDPVADLDRRQGKEPWDYQFFGQTFSHKEGMTPLFTAVWQPGGGPKNTVVKYQTWDFLHPVVFVYAPKCVTAKWSGHLKAISGQRVPARGSAWTLGPHALDLSTTKDAVGAHALLRGSTLDIERTWRRDQWTAMSLADVRVACGIPRSPAGDIWLIKGSWAGGKPIGWSVNSTPAEVILDSDVLMPGIYVLRPEWLSQTPLRSNNKAHFVDKPQVTALMRKARDEGNYVPMPLWPMEFADTNPPNLYAQQRARYDTLMQARTV